MNRLLFPLSAIVLTAAIGVGCGAPDRTDYRDNAAEEVCMEAEACDNLDGLFGENYSSYDECVLEERSRFNSMWSEDECGMGQIDPDDYDRCIDRAVLAACDGGFLDNINALTECRASVVCTAEPID